MKSLFAFAVASILLSSGTSLAQSAKSSLQVTDLTLLNEVTTSGANAQAAGEWKTLMQSNLKTSEQKDVVIGVSMEAGLHTDTLVRSKTGTQDSSSAEATIEVRVLVDGRPALPGNVIFAQRYQHLMAKFGGILQECTDANGDGTITQSECLFTDEELQLVLRTLNAHSFNFVLDDLGSGIHNIQVQARVILNSNQQTGAASAGAWIGKGSVSVEEVRLVKGLDLTL